MLHRRSLLLHGLRLVVTLPGALLWTYALNLGLAVLFSLRVHAQVSSVLDHSLAAERVSSAFDIGTLSALSNRIIQNTPSTGATSYVGLPLYLIGYFILVPGTLFCFQAASTSRLPILFSSGIAFFWRFVRITLLTMVAFLVVLGPLVAAQSAWSSHVDELYTGGAALYYQLPGLIVIFLVACLMRLYFDLVEVYTIQLADQFRPSGKADRRVRRTLLPAWRALWANLPRAYGSFVFLSLLGFAAVLFTGRIAAHMLAQSRAWPLFLLAQGGLFSLLATRFWQRGAETILAVDHPLPPPALMPSDYDFVTAPPIRYTPSGTRMAYVAADDAAAESMPPPETRAEAAAPQRNDNPE